MKLENKHQRDAIRRVLRPGLELVVTGSRVSLSCNDIIVAVMGPTGSGKSTFIELATGLKGLAGHNLESCTTKITPIRVSSPDFQGNNIVFVDTPGFDDTHKSDVDIFNTVSAWLKETYSTQIQLSGLIYFHRISDNRMAGTPRKNLHIFEKMCGKKFSNIVLATSMWDDVEQDVGGRREDELRNIFWKAMIQRGSTVKRFLRTRDSVLDVLSPIFDYMDKIRPMLLQEEVVNLGLTLKQTSAGRALSLELESLVSSNEKILSALRKEMQNATPEEIQEIFQEFCRAREKLRLVEADTKKMKTTWLDRFKGTTVVAKILR